MLFILLSSFIRHKEQQHDDEERGNREQTFDGQKMLTTLARIEVYGEHQKRSTFKINRNYFLWKVKNHLNIPSWVFMCALKLQASANLLLHNSHPWGLLPNKQTKNNKKSINEIKNDFVNDIERQRMTDSDR